MGCVLVVCAFALSDRLAAVDGAAVAAAFAGTSFAAIAAAVVFTALSHVAVSAYDPLVTPLLQCATPRRLAMKSGFAAVAIGQTTGFSPIVGALIRHRLMRGEGATGADAARRTALVAFGFLFGLIGALVAMVLVRPEAFAEMSGWSLRETSAAAAAGLALWFFAVGVIVRKGALTIGGFSVPTPDGRSLFAFAGLAFIDVAFAAAALWALTPAAAGLSFEQVFLAFSVALAFGIMSNAPGGIGVFEATLFVLLPSVDPASLIASIALFRVVYYGAPFLAAVALLTLEEFRGGEARASHFAEAVPAFVEDALAPGLAASDRAEAELAHLGDKRFLMSADGEAFLMFSEARGVLTAIGDPVGARSSWPELVSGFLDLAADERRAPAFYKIGTNTAALCRAMGLKTDRLGHEAEVDPQSFDIGARSHRQLRRKVRQAAKAGVEIRRFEPGEAPLDALKPISDRWLSEKGVADGGFSRGVFDAAYLKRFPVLVAEQDGAPIAFLSLWRSGDGAEWSIDLMRGERDAPAGVMQALIAAAIDDAREAGVSRFNLCMAPMSGLEDAKQPLERAFAWIFAKRDRCGLKGLHRFKASFDPDWRPRFIAHQGGVGAGRALYAAARLTCSIQHRRKRANGSAHAGPFRVRLPGIFREWLLSAARLPRYSPPNWRS